MYVCLFTGKHPGLSALVAILQHNTDTATDSQPEGLVGEVSLRYQIANHKANESNLLAIKNRSLYRIWSGDCGGELRENWLTGNRWQTAIKGSFADELKWEEMEVEQVC